MQHFHPISTLYIVLVCYQECGASGVIVTNIFVRYKLSMTDNYNYDITCDIISAVKLTVSATGAINVDTYLLIDVNNSRYLTFSGVVVIVRADSRPNNKKPLFCSLKQQIC